MPAVVGAIARSLRSFATGVATDPAVRRVVIRICLLLVLGGMVAAAALTPRWRWVIAGVGLLLVVVWGAAEIVRRGGTGTTPRLAVFVAVIGVAVAATIHPRYLWTLVAVDVALLLGWALAELLTFDLERLVGFRYLHRGRRSRWAPRGLVAGGVLVVAGVVMFVAAHGRARGIETAGIVSILVGGLIVVVAFLMRLFSVFTTVSTMGVVLGVAALVVVFAVTSGFEREFQNKVLALNAHLIVQAYGDADFEELADIQRRLAGLPNVVRMAPFLFSPGEVMIGRVGANLKGIDLRDGADDLKRTLVQGSIEDLARPASCPLPATTPRKTSDDVGRVAIGVELARKLRKNVGDCVSIMVPFSSGATDAPIAYQFKVVGLFRMGFNEYDTRIAYVSIADAMRLANVRRLVSGVELRFDDPVRALSASKDVQRLLGSPHHLVDWRELNQNLFRALEFQKVLIALILVIIIVVAAFNIVSSLTMIVLSKVREVAILKSMGGTSRLVARVFLIGGTTVGMIGTSLGIGYGLLVCLLARLYGYSLDPKVYLIGQLPVQIRPEELVGVAAATLVISWIATLYPSFRASRMRAVDGLRSA
jgi:lipoprotein-releasing system permease protein